MKRRNSFYRYRSSFWGKVCVCVCARRGDGVVEEVGEVCGAVQTEVNSSSTRKFSILIAGRIHHSALLSPRCVFIGSKE